MSRTTLLAACAALLLGGLVAVAWAGEGPSSTVSSAAVLDRELSSADPGQRLYAVKMLGRLGAVEANRSEVVARLERCAGDSNPYVAAQARHELERLAGVPARAGATESSLDASIAESTAEEQAQDLGADLAAPDARYRLHATKALGRLARTGETASLAVALLESALRDRSLAVAAQAEAELARLDGRPVVVPAAPPARSEPAAPSDVEDYAALYSSSPDAGERLRAVKRLAALAARPERVPEIARILEAARSDHEAVVAAQARQAVASLEGRGVVHP